MRQLPSRCGFVKENISKVKRCTYLLSGRGGDPRLHIDGTLIDKMLTEEYPSLQKMINSS
jgi:hypothetical protein